MLTPNEVLGLLENYQAKLEVGPDNIKRAAVCIVLQQTEQGLALLMIKRADYEGDPWSGHMAFPGGRVETTDASPLAAALRECKEEVGIDLNKAAKLVCPLSEVRATLRGHKIDMIVSPYVFITGQELACVPNREVAKTVLIPLSFFIDDSTRDNFKMVYEGQQTSRPCYYFGEDKVWGLSLLFIDELLQIIKR